VAKEPKSRVEKCRCESADAQSESETRFLTCDEILLKSVAEWSSGQVARCIGGIGEIGGFDSASVLSALVVGFSPGQSQGQSEAPLFAAGALDVAVSLS
jgi:hypothetical protein